MKVFITGGSGFIGTNLVEYYINSGYSVLSFDIQEPQNEKHNNVWVKGDILNLEQLRKSVNEFMPEYIIHLAARTDLLEKKDLINGYSENIKGVENLIVVARNLQSLKRILFASSRLVCKIDYLPKSYDDYCPPNLYGLSKVIGERLVKTSHLDKEWVIFRPTSIWGPWFDSPYIIFFKMIQKKFFYKIIGHNPEKSFGYVGNSVFQINKIMLAPERLVNRKTFYLCDYPPLKLNSWAAKISLAFRKGKIISFPKVLITPFALIGDIFFKMGFNRVPITTFRLNNLVTNMIYPTNELEEICGALPFTIDGGVSTTVEWMKNFKNRDKFVHLKNK